MCNQFIAIQRFEELQAKTATGETTHTPETRIYPRREAPLLTEKGLSERTLTNLVWGFTVPRHTDLVFNTRTESALDGLPLWQNALRERRCVIPARAFFEYHRTKIYFDSKARTNKKLLYRFEPVEDSLFYMAGLFEHGTFSIFTKPAETEAKQIHPRVPVLLQANDVRDWLANAQVTREILETYLHAETPALFIKPDIDSAMQISEQLSLL